LDYNKKCAGRGDNLEYGKRKTRLLIEKRIKEEYNNCVMNTVYDVVPVQNRRPMDVRGYYVSDMIKGKY
jgi:hypothetical protein